MFFCLSGLSFVFHESHLEVKYTIEICTCWNIKNFLSIWNCWIIIHLIQCSSNSKGFLPFSGIVSVFVPYWKYDFLLSCYERHKTILQIYLNLFLHLELHALYTLTFLIFQDGVTLRSLWSRSSTEKKLQIFYILTQILNLLPKINTLYLYS